MRRCLIAVGVVGALACRPAPVLSPEDAGPTPTLELASQAIDAGQAALRFGQTVQREGLISIRTHDAAAPLALDVSATGPLTTEAVLTLEPDVWTEVPVALAISRVGELRGVVSLTPREKGIAAVSATVFGVGTAAPDCIPGGASDHRLRHPHQGCPVAHQPVRLTNDCAVPRLLSGAEVAPFVEPFALSQLTSLPRRQSFPSAVRSSSTARSSRIGSPRLRAHSSRRSRTALPTAASWGAASTPPRRSPRGSGSGEGTRGEWRSASPTRRSRAVTS